MESENNQGLGWHEHSVGVLSRLNIQYPIVLLAASDAAVGLPIERGLGQRNVSFMHAEQQQMASAENADEWPGAAPAKPRPFLACASITQWLQKLHARTPSAFCTCTSHTAKTFLGPQKIPPASQIH